MSSLPFRLWRRLTRGFNPEISGPLPQFLIIGAQKAGTTSLFNYLLAHPQIASVKTKELHFFTEHFARGPHWYRGQFQRRKGAIPGEATPYYLFHPLVPARIAALLPNAKFVVLLRNPADRAYSHFQHETRLGHETLSFEAALEAENARLEGEEAKMSRDPNYHSLSHQRFSYRARGLYAEQLERWFGVFDRSRFLILESGEFYANPQKGVSQTLDFLGMAPLQLAQTPVFNAFGYENIEPQQRAALGEWFRPHNARLYQLLGRDLGWDE